MTGWRQGGRIGPRRRSRARLGQNVPVKVLLANPTRERQVAGPRRVKDVMHDLDLDWESYLVIVDGRLVTGDTLIDDQSTVEMRPVISGGSA